MARRYRSPYRRRLRRPRRSFHGGTALNQRGTLIAAGIGVAAATAGGIGAHPQIVPAVARAVTGHATTASITVPAAAAGTASQRAFINEVAPGAVAAQRTYGVPAAVTIAQAIDESAWGGSSLAASYHNLFGIKGSGPAGSVTLPTQEFTGGGYVTISAAFAAYPSDASSIAAHDALLAGGGVYAQAMSDRGSPDRFANDLTGVYATDPSYGATLISYMRNFGLYRFDS